MMVMTASNQQARYIPIKQQPYCCMQSCFQMIMARRDIPLVSQAVMATMMGLVVPPKDKDKFPDARVSDVPPYGTIIMSDAMMPSEVFKKLHIPLVATLVRIDEFDGEDDISDYLVDKLNDGVDLMVGVQIGKLYGNTLPYSHSLLVDSYNPESSMVRLVDPEPNMPQCLDVSLPTLIDAMEELGARNWGGFIEVTESS